MMKNETFMSASEAVEKGFADEVMTFEDIGAVASLENGLLPQAVIDDFYANRSKCKSEIQNILRELEKEELLRDFKLSFIPKERKGMFKEKWKKSKAQIMNIGAEITNKTEELKSLNTDDLEKAVVFVMEMLWNLKEEAEDNLKTYEVAKQERKLVSWRNSWVKVEGKSYRESVNEFIRSKVAFEMRASLKVRMMLVHSNEAVNPATDGLARDWKVTSKEIEYYTRSWSQDSSWP